jgi:hypothetical protein
MGFSWSYDPETKTVFVYELFNGKLTKLPADTKTISFDVGSSRFNKPIYKKNLPPNVQCIVFGYSFNQPIKEDTLPSNLTDLTFGYNFNQPINQGTLPNSLTHLTFGDHYNQPINQGVLPNSLTHLTFGKCSNKPVSEGVLPNSRVFNQSLDILPVNLKKLSIHNSAYNKKLNNLPYGLKTLVIPENYSIDNVKVPFGCEVIRFSDYHRVFLCYR